jgi:hypothetical protein
MAIKSTDLYFYLGRRDKGGIRILAKFQGRPQIAVRVDDIGPLQLPVGWETQLEQIVFDSRMLWEPWIESADTFDDFRASLKIRGYSNVPVSAQPEFIPATIKIPTVNMSHLPRKTTMLRKGS